MDDTPKAREFREELHIGEGCCQGLNSWRQDVRPRLGEEQAFSSKALGQVMEVFIRTLSRQLISGDVVALTVAGTIKELRRKGVPEQEIQNISARIEYVFSENRPKLVRDFQG